MRTRQLMAAGLAAVMVSVPIFAQQGPPTVTMSGIAKKEAKKPYTNYTTRARNAQSGEIAGTATNGDPDAQFSITGLPPGNYVIELIHIERNGNQKLVCTEGPFDMTQSFVRNNIEINCGKVPAAWWLLGVAAAAGVTAGVVISTASASE